MMHRRLSALLLAGTLASTAAVAACAPPVVVATPEPVVETRPAAPSTGAQVIQAMYDRYAGKWYRNLTFVQTSVYYNRDGSVLRRETWYEAGAVPGKLRIDIGAPNSGNTTLYVNDSVYAFRDGRQVLARPGHNELMVLGFDVYAQPPERSAALLSQLGFDMGVVRMENLNGRPHYVVGAREGDRRSKQFWIDAENMLFTRILQAARPSASAPADSLKSEEIRFQKYVPHGGGWVAEEVDFTRDGVRFFFESYANVRVNQDLDPALFDPRRFSTARHWFTP